MAASSSALLVSGRGEERRRFARDRRFCSYGMFPARGRAVAAAGRRRQLTIVWICACFCEQACAALALLAHGTQGFALSTTLPGRMTKVCAAAAAVPRLRPQIGAGRRAAASPALRMQFGLGNLFGGGGGGAKGKVVSLEEAGVVPDVSSRPSASQKFPAVPREVRRL
jgi:hypothetical protein